MMNPFFEKLCETADSEPNKICFSLYKDLETVKELTFSQMRSRVAAASKMLAEHGVSRGDIVLIFAQHSEGMLLAFFGAQWMGAIPAFMPPPTIKQNIATWASSHLQLVERIRPHLVVGEPSCLDHIKALGVKAVLSTEIFENHSVASEEPAADIDMDSVAFLQHSSGTTGLKKGVTVTYRQLLTQVDQYGTAIGIDGNCNIVSWLPIYHDMGLIAATLLPMRHGVPVRLIDTFAWLSNPASLIALLEKFDNAYCWLPNFAFGYIAKRARIELRDAALSKVSAVINCSEPCKQEDMSAFRDRFVPFGLKPEAIQVCYAAAEYVFAMTQTSFGESFKSIAVDAEILESEKRAVAVGAATSRTRVMVSVGKPVAGAEIRIGDSLPEGSVGEVLIRGPSLCSGYFRNEEMTSKKFVDGWYRSGDLGFWYQGSLFITGRMDDLIIVRGKNIYAHDIEAIASSVGGIRPGRASAFGIDDNSGSQQLVVAVESTQELSPKALKIELSSQINVSFGITPFDIVVVRENSLIKTTSGKMSRSENRKSYITKGFDVLPNT